MLINKRDINKKEDWVDIEDLAVRRVEGLSTATPTINNFESTNVFGRKRLHEVSYPDRKINVELLVAAETAAGVIEKTEAVVRLLSGQFALILSNDPKRMFREVSLEGAIEKERIARTAIVLKIKLIAFDPFRYDLDEVEQELTGITEDKTFDLVNAGDYKVKPLLVLSGKAEEINITIGPRTTGYVNLKEGEEIMIDCSDLSVIRSTGDNEESALANWRDNFVELEPGVNNVKVSGESMNVDIKLIYRNTYL